MQGRWRVSIVVSPRLTPEAADEQQLASFPEWLDWPATLREHEVRARDRRHDGAADPHRASRTSRPTAWSGSACSQPTLPVAGFVFKDMSQVNLRSFPVRNVLGFVRKHYEALSLAAGGGEHPTLLPWRARRPGAEGHAERTRHAHTASIDFGDALDRVPAARLRPLPRRAPARATARARTRRSSTARVFNDDSCIKAPVRRCRAGPAGRRAASFALRALPPDWEDPALIRNGTIAVADPADRERRAVLMDQFSGPAEYALWQSDRFYRRTQPTKAQKAMRRPGFAGGTHADQAARVRLPPARGVATATIRTCCAGSAW